MASIIVRMEGVIIETINTVSEYLWLRNGTDTVGNEYQLNVSMPGSYTVSAINGNCISNISNPNIIKKLSGTSIGTNVLGESLPPYFEKFEDGPAGWYTEIEPLTSPSDWELAAPSGSAINGAINNSKSWITNSTGAHSNKQQSWVISPCFDFTYSSEPIIAFQYTADMKDNVTGAVLQYNLGANGGWQTLGQDTLSDLGENWYNGNNIISEPGTQGSGWTDSSFGWNIARYPLDSLVGQNSVRFRMAFATEGLNSELQKGFAFDDVWIGERYKPILVETFTTSSQDTTNQLVYDALQNDESLIGIEYHLIDATDDLHIFNIPDNNSRSVFYSIQPLNNNAKTVIDGEIYTGVTASNSSLTWSKDDYQVHQLEPSIFEISPIIKEIQGDKITFRSNVVLKDTTDILLRDNYWKNTQDAIDDGKIVIRGVVIQDSVLVVNTNTYARNVMRKMTPDQGGEVFDTTQTRYWFSWTDNFVSSASALNVVMFVQNIDTKEVYIARSGATQFVATNNVSNSDYNNLTVFPNPANQYFEAKFDQPITEDATWAIYSIDGKIIDNGSLPKNLEGFRYESNHLPSGVYFLSIKTPSYQIAPKKIVIVK